MAFSLVMGALAVASFVIGLYALNNRGPPGPAGPRGATGARGPSGGQNTTTTLGTFNVTFSGPIDNLTFIIAYQKTGNVVSLYIQSFGAEYNDNPSFITTDVAAVPEALMPLPAFTFFQYPALVLNENEVLGTPGSVVLLSDGKIVITPCWNFWTGPDNIPFTGPGFVGLFVDVTITYIVHDPGNYPTSLDMPIRSDMLDMRTRSGMIPFYSGTNVTWRRPVRKRK
jgi:hypothetical protein